MKNNKFKLFVIILIFFLCTFFIKYKSTYGIYKEVLNTKVYLSVLEPNTTVTINYLTDGGTITSGNNPDVVAAHTEIGTLPVVVKEGYNFIGWYTEDGSEKIGPDYVVDNDERFVAHWAKIICKKVTDTNKLHTETCLSGGCKVNGTGFATNDIIRYGTTFDSINSPRTGDAYDCDVYYDDIFDTKDQYNTRYTERFYFVREKENQGSDNTAVLVYYTSFDENGRVDRTTAEGDVGAYNYSTALTYLPNSTTWDNPGLIDFDGNGQVSRFISVADLENACEPIVTNTEYFTSCRQWFWLETSKFQRSNVAQAGIWIEENNNNYYRINTSTLYINASGSSNKNMVRPVIEIPFNQLDGYRERNSYTITFITNDPNISVAHKTKYEGQTIGPFIKLSKQGYRFIGWFYDNNTFQNEVDENEALTGNVIVYAKWEEIIPSNNMDYVFYIPGSCTFNATSATTADPITSSSNDCISTINHTNANIDYTDSSISDYSYTGNKFIDTHVALFSEDNIGRDFEIGFTIDAYDTTNVHGQATLVNSKLENSSKFYPGFVIRRNNSNNTSIVLTEKFGSNAEYRTTYTYSSGITIRVARHSGVMRYYSSSSNKWIDLQDINYYDEPFALHTWIGAFSDETGFNNDGSSSNAGRYTNATLSNIYIKLEQDPQEHTVTFNGEGGTVSISPNTMDVSHGTSIGASNLPTAYKPGYQFCGWWTAASGGTRITGNELITTDGIEYHAQYKILRTITFDADGGILSIAPDTSIQVANGDSIGEVNLPTASKPGQTFVGWYSQTGSGGTHYDGTEPIVADDTYYAQYKIYHTITFDADGGTLSIAPDTSIQVANGDSIGASNLPTAKKYGNHFKGWYSQTGSGGTHYDGTETITSGDTYYAQWIELSGVIRTVTFYDDDYNSANPTVIDYEYVSDGDSLGAYMIPNPTRSNYAFGGWYIEGNSILPFNSTTVVEGGDVDVVASWREIISLATISPDPLSVALNSSKPIVITASDGGLVEDVTYLSDDESVATVVDGVVHGEGAGSTTITITGVLSGLTRTVTVNVFDSYSVTYMDGDTVVDTYNIPIGSAIGNNVPADQTKSGYIFDRWYYYDGSNLTATPLDTEKVITEDEVYKVGWAPGNTVAAIGNQYYSSYNTAISNVPTTGVETEIRLLQNATASGRVEITSTKNVVINGQNKILSCSSGNIIWNHFGTVTLKNVTLECGASTVAPIDNAGTLNVIDSTINSTLSGANGRAAIFNTGTVNIYGNSVLTSAAQQRSTVQNSTNNEVTQSAAINIYGGNIYQTASDCTKYAVEVIAGSSATITGGTIISAAADKPAVYNRGTLVIGTRNNAYDVTSPVIQGEQYGVDSSVSFSIFDGIIKGKYNNRAVNNFSKIDETNGIETGSTRVTGTDGDYYTLYYSMP